MTRLRSPGYPSYTLPDVIEFARKIHEQDRQHPLERGIAAKHMGFSGISGTSDRALSALMHFGLAEKAGKGEVRISDLALRIIHPDTLEEKRAALRVAAFNPELFAELRSRYSGSLPSQQSLSSYLSRMNFAPAAIPPATRAYLETCQFLQREGAYESDANSPVDGPESARDQKKDEPVMQPSVSLPAPMPPSPPPAALSVATLALNEPNITINGQRTVRIEALLDAAGLVSLEQTLTALKMLIKAPTQAAQLGAAPTTGSDDDNDR